MALPVIVWVGAAGAGLLGLSLLKKPATPTGTRTTVGPIPTGATPSNPYALTLQEQQKTFVTKSLNSQVPGGGDIVQGIAGGIHAITFGLL